MLAAEPAARVQAILAPLRAVADEIVVAGGARVDELYRRCSGDWILRLDEDEVPSTALIARLPELIRAHGVDRYLIARAWLYPDGQRVIDERPWSTDFVARLVRAEGAARFERDDDVAAGPTAYAVEPIYHLALLLSDARQRQATAIRDEVAEPWMTIGGERYHHAFQLPERRGSLALRPVPSADRERVARVLEPAAAIAPARAHIEPYGDAPAFTTGARERLYVHVTNNSDSPWPWGLDQRSPVLLSYHWLHPEREGVHDGLRTPLPAAVEPGATVLAPLDVLAPDEPGDWVLEIDLVHEHVAWFECGARLDMTIGKRDEQPRLVASRGRARRMQRVRIPGVLHRIWLGDAPLPAAFAHYGRTFSDHHPDWELRLWTDADLDALGIGEDERDRARTASELSNLIRYEILSRHGGIYVDTDVECRRRFDPLLRGIDAFAALEQPGRVGTAVLGSVAGHRAFARAAREARDTLGLGLHSPDANGPYFLSLILEQESGVHIFDRDIFYPYLWDEPERAGEAFPDAYAVHHWAASWQ